MGPDTRNVLPGDQHRMAPPALVGGDEDRVGRVGRAGLPELPDHLGIEQRMVRGNAPVRVDVREHSALIEKSSTHRKSSRESAKK